MRNNNIAMSLSISYYLYKMNVQNGKYSPKAHTFLSLLLHIIKFIRLSSVDEDVCFLDLKVDYIMETYFSIL